MFIIPANSYRFRDNVWYILSRRQQEGTGLNRVLFVCTGNTCRSPMAEAMLKHKRPDLEVQSAGVFAGHGQAANPKAIEALQEKGITFNPCLSTAYEGSNQLGGFGFDHDRRS